MKARAADFDTVNSIYAKADTVAFMLWIPIVRALEESRDTDYWDVTIACSAAIVAERLHFLAMEIGKEEWS